MSDFESNPFADPHAANPFADQSVRNASQQGQRVETLDEFNPFAEDQFVPRTTSQAAVIEPAPPAYTPPEPQPNYVASEYLQRRQEELERKAAELDRREQSMNQNVLAAARVKNFPPLPSRFPIKPCFYQDISVDIPREFQRIVRLNFYFWIGSVRDIPAVMLPKGHKTPDVSDKSNMKPIIRLMLTSLIFVNHDKYFLSVLYHVLLAYICVLFLNVWVSVAFFAVCTHSDVTCWGDGSTLGLSILYFCLWTPASFVCWFRAVYNAFRLDSSFFFFAYFFVFFMQFVTNVVQSIGIAGSGSVGWIVGLQMIGRKGDSSHLAVGIVMVIVGILFTILAVLCMLLLIKVHRLYRSTGGNFAKAQEEFAQGVVSNRTVQNAAGSLASSAVQNAAQGAYSGSSSRDPRY